MKNRSNNPSHHEQMLLPQSYISLLKKENTNCRGANSSLFFKTRAVVHSTVIDALYNLSSIGQSIIFFKPQFSTYPHIWWMARRNYSHYFQHLASEKILQDSHKPIISIITNGKQMLSVTRITCKHTNEHWERRFKKIKSVLICQKLYSNAN